MKIGITTFQWSNNYGAVLQTHALQSFLSAKGHEVQVVDYRPNVPLSFAHKWIARSPNGCFQKWKVAYKDSLFESFRRKHMTRTSEIFWSFSELRRISDRYDMIITGSDQVWNPKWLSQFNGLFDLYFLSFVAPQTRCISYAASFGHADKSTMSEDWQKLIGEKLKMMDAISVREKSGIDLVRDLSGRTDAIQVVDPTLLLDRLHYENLTDSKSKRKSFLFSYMLHGLECDAETACHHISEVLQLNTLKCDGLTSAFRGGYTLPSPRVWLRHIRDAVFMVTNSFHGVVFCLIFHTPFIALIIDGENGSMNSRIVDLLKAVGLSHRILNPRQPVSKWLCKEKIDWNEIDRKILSIRSNSIGYMMQQGIVLE
jgi:hypothetical protein